MCLFSKRKEKKDSIDKKELKDVVNRVNKVLISSDSKFYFEINGNYFGLCDISSVCGSYYIYPFIYSMDFAYSYPLELIKLDDVKELERILYEGDITILKEYIEIKAIENHFSMDVETLHKIEKEEFDKLMSKRKNIAFKKISSLEVNDILVGKKVMGKMSFTYIYKISRVMVLDENDYRTYNVYGCAYNENTESFSSEELISLDFVLNAKPYKDITKVYKLIKK